MLVAEKRRKKSLVKGPVESLEVAETVGKGRRWFEGQELVPGAWWMNLAVAAAAATVPVSCQSEGPV